MTDDNEVAQRSTSERSTISDTADSSGGGLAVVPYETPTQHMATEFIHKVISVWGESSIIICSGRTTNSTYLAIVYASGDANESGQSRDFSFGANHNNPDEYYRVLAVTDGSLRFTFIPRDTEVQAYWPRQVACLALEVFPMSLC